MKRGCYVTCLVIFIEFLASIYGFEPQVGYPPDNPCIDPWTACANASEPLYKVYDPADCHQYYECIKNTAGNFLPSSVPLSCDEGYYFNYMEQNCIVDVNNCSKACINTGCSFECSETDGLIANPSDCGLFNICINMTISPDTPCNSSAPYFDGTACTEFEYKCCERVCFAYCPEIGIQVEDPFDCNSYYLCENVGAPPENRHYQCPDGEYFDKSQGYCDVEDSPCQNSCQKCVPYCPEIGVQVEDPFDCRSYYLCVSEGTPSEDRHYQCPDGEYFDKTQGICVEEDSACQNSCQESSAVFRHSILP